MSETYPIDTLGVRARCEDCDWNDSRVLPNTSAGLYLGNWAKSMSLQHIKQTGHSVILWEKTRMRTPD